MEITDTHEIDYQRNGISGEGFWTITFSALVDGKEGEFLGVVFPPDESKRHEFHNPHTAIMSLVDGKPVLSQHWRGDHFHEALYDVIDQEQKDRGYIE